MKKEIKGFIVGALSVSLLSAGVSYAAGWLENISVVKNSATISANYNPVNADNFIYNDTTYVPLRAVTESLGCYVNWNDETRNIAIYNQSLDLAKLTADALNYWDFVEKRNNSIQYMNEQLNSLLGSALMDSLDNKAIQSFKNTYEDSKDLFLDIADDYPIKENNLRFLVEEGYINNINENTITDILDDMCVQYAEIYAAFEGLKTFNSYDIDTRLKLYLADNVIATNCTDYINSSYKRHFTIATDITNVRNALYDYIRNL